MEGTTHGLEWDIHLDGTRLRRHAQGEDIRIDGTYTLRRHAHTVATHKRSGHAPAQTREDLGGGYELQTRTLLMRVNQLYYTYPHYSARSLITLSGVEMQALRLVGVG